MNQSVQSRFGDGETIGELQTDPIDGLNQIVIIELPPLVARKWAQVIDEGDLRSGSKIGSAVAGTGVVGA